MMRWLKALLSARRRWTEFSAGLVGVQIAGNASATRAVKIVIVVIIIVAVIIVIKYDWLLYASISSCLVCNAVELMYVPLMPLRWPGKLDCAGVLESLPSGKDVLSVPWAVSAEFVGFLVESSKQGVGRRTSSSGGRSPAAI